MITNFNLFLNEDVALAKSILTKHKQEIPLGEKDPDYLTIRDMLKGKDGYVGLFTKLRYENNVTIENLKLLLNDIIRLKDYLTFLPKPITQYDDYEKIYDDLRTLESQKYINYWLKEMPSILKNEYKNLSSDLKHRFSEQILTWQKLEEDVRNSIYRLYFREGNSKGKISLFKTFNDFLKDLSNKIDSATEGFQYENVIKNIRKANAKVEYENFDDQIVVAYIPNVDASKKLGKETSWCISYSGGNNRWETYNSFSQLTKQYFIWNFNLPFSDNYCMVALTVDKDGKITYMHRKDDYSILNSSDDYFEKWNISKEIFKPLSEKELEIRKKYIEYDTILKDYKSILALDEKKFNEIISFFGGEFNWNAYDYCVIYLIDKKLNQYFYNLIKENKLDIEDLIEDGLIKWTLEYDNLEMFYHLIDNYDADSLDDSIGDIYKEIFNLNKEESEVIKVVDYFTSKFEKTLDNFFVNEASIPDGFFDNIIRHDYLELFKRFYNKIPKSRRNRYMYHPSRGKNTTSFLGYAYKVYEDALNSDSDNDKVIKPIKIIEYLINNGAYNDGKLFVYLFHDNKSLYDKLIDNTYFYPDGLENIYVNLSISPNYLSGTKPKLYTDIIDDLISKDKFDNKYYVDSNNLNKDIQITVKFDLNEDFLYLINLLIRYVKENVNDTFQRESKVKDILKEESNGNQKEVYKKILTLSDDKIYPLLKYFPDDSVSKVFEHFIQKNNLDGLKKFFSYNNFDPKKLSGYYNNIRILSSSDNVEIIKYILSLKPFNRIDNDDLLKFKEKHPELLDLLLKSVDYKVSSLYLLEDIEIFKEIINSMPDYTKPEDIWQFKAENLIYAIDNKNLKLQKDSLSNALEYDYMPDSPYGVEIVKKMCQAGCSIEHTRYDKPLLFICLDKGNYHVFKYLVEECNKNPYKLKKESRYGVENEFLDPLQYAIKSQKIDFIEYIINKFKKPINTKYFINTNVKKENCKKMSDLVLKYIKPDKISDDDKINLVHSYDEDFGIFCKLFEIYKPDPTSLLKLSVHYSRNNSNEKNIVEFLAEKGADIQSVYDENKRKKSLSQDTRDFFKDYIKNKNKKKKENIETNFDFFKDFISEKNKNSKMKYLKEYNEFFAGTETPVKTPTKTPTKNPTKRPSPIRRDRPTVLPKPKASVEDVVNRIKGIADPEIIKIIKNKYEKI